MSRILSGTRYLILVPIVGLLIAAAGFFVFGGFNLIKLLLDAMLHGVDAHGTVPFEVEVVEYVHTFLIGTVLYITAVGFYQLFIDEIKFPGWLKIDSTEELETNLIGVTVVVLAVHFMGIVFTDDPEYLLEFGIGIAAPIAALALFVGLRTWSTNITRKREDEEAREQETDQDDEPFGS